MVNLIDTHFTLSGLAPNITYYWRVVAKDEYGLTTNSDIWEMTTGNTPSDLTVSGLTTSPAGGMTADSSVTLTATIAGQTPIPEINETNNRLETILSAIAGILPPELVDSFPPGNGVTH
jgi:hypothetical protein